jgi:hypothetical protein
MNRILPTLLLAVGIAGAVVAPAVAADGTGVRTVCAERTYVKRKPGFLVIGTLFEDQRIRVTRYDRNGLHAYGHVRKHGWVKTADLCR